MVSRPCRIGKSTAAFKSITPTYKVNVTLSNFESWGGRNLEKKLANSGLVFIRAEIKLLVVECGAAAPEILISSHLSGGSLVREFFSRDL